MKNKEIILEALNFYQKHIKENLAANMVDVSNEDLRKIVKIEDIKDSLKSGGTEMEDFLDLIKVTGKSLSKKFGGLE